MESKIVLIRHGITVGNEQHMYYGSTDVSLSERGMHLLEKQRDDYANASRQDKERMSKSLLEFEDKVLQAETQVNRMENDVRSAEINYLNR